ncbi:MAG: ABC transporter ATP-binding protein [Phycisphaerae bacterium]
MKPFWRLMRGAWPYRWQIVFSFLCAIGVSLSYASGVATLYPVMKIFMGAEGVHGWRDQTIAQQRLHIQTLGLNASARKGKLAISILGVGAKAQAPLHSIQIGDQIRSVRIVSPTGQAMGTADSWLKMMSLLANAKPGSTAQLTVTANDGSMPRTLAATLPPLKWSTRLWASAVQLMPHRRIWSLFWVVIVFIGLCIVGSIFRYLQTFISAVVANKMIVDLRRRLFNHIVDMPLSYMSNKGTHDLVSRVTLDTEFVAGGLGTVLGRAILEPTKSLGVAILAVMVDWQMFLVMLVVLPTMGVVIRKYGKKMMAMGGLQLQGWSAVVGISSEALGSMRVIKAYSGTGYERRRFARANRELFQSIRHIQHYMALSRPLFETMSIILVSIPLMWAAELTFHHVIGRDEFFLMLACLIAIFEPLRKLNDINSQVQMANSAAARCFEIIDLPKEPNLSPDLPKLPRHGRSVQFEHVSFKYPEHEEWVLRDINLEVTHGQVVAVVGANGSGKTTLLSLLPRLYIPTDGRILIDGVDTATVAVNSLRRQIGLVTQETVLFSDTVYNNIAYGTRQASNEKIMQAAQRSYVDEFARDLPQGYQTQTGQGGIRLSGGQRQRIALARAILRNPSILILDEAMSQVDSDSEAKIALALEDFMKDRTTFIIAHRFSTVMSADLVVCLDAGRIVGCGTHQELFTSCPPYQRLYETQLIGQTSSSEEHPTTEILAASATGEAS